MAEVKHLAIDIGNTLLEPLSGDWNMTKYLHGLLMENPCLDNSLSFFYLNVEIAKKKMAPRVKMTSVDEEFDYLIDFYNIAINYDDIRLSNEKLKDVVNDRIYGEDIYTITKKLPEYLENIDMLSKGLFSNTYPSVIKYLDIHGINEGYIHNCLSFELGVKKPSISMYNYLQSITGYKPNEILIIDDNPECIKKADILGFRTVLFDKRDIGKCIKEIGDYI